MPIIPQSNSSVARVECQPQSPRWHLLPWSLGAPVSRTGRPRHRPSEKCVWVESRPKHALALAGAKQQRGDDVRFGICGKRRICGCGELRCRFVTSDSSRGMQHTRSMSPRCRLAVAGLYPVPTCPSCACRAGSDPPLRPTAKIRFLTRGDVTRSQPHPGPQHGIPEVDRRAKSARPVSGHRP